MPPLKHREGGMLRVECLLVEKPALGGVAADLDGWMFFFGIFFPILWIFGAFMRPPGTVVQA
jgi:hypothetical protein